MHTAENPGGEIRGQLFLDQDVTFLALLSGDEEVPPVTTDARGLGLFHYTIGTLTLDVNVQVPTYQVKLRVHISMQVPSEKTAESLLI